jgi:probable HAF family extracellular repeat protein
MKDSLALAGLFVLAVSSSFGVSEAWAQAPASPTYQLVDLGALEGINSSAIGINNAGDIVGTSQVHDASGNLLTHAFLYRNGVMTDLGCLPGQTICRPAAVNGAGQIIGQANNSGGSGPIRFRAFLYQNGAMTDITPADKTEAIANDINEVGTIVGRARVLQWRAFVFSGPSGMDLGRFSGSNLESSEATAINNHDQVVGYWVGTGNVYHGFLYDLPSRTWVEIQAPCSPNCFVQPLDVNDAGQVVGGYSPAAGLSHAFLYDHGQFLDLDPQGVGSSVAFAVNASGDVVGYWPHGSGQGGFHAFLYKDGVMQSIEDLIPPSPDWNFDLAYDINDSGQIVGPALHDNQGRAFLLTPNRPPTASAGGPYVVDEGSAIVVTASGSDPEGGPLTYAWDLNGDGIFETPGQSVSVAGGDGPSIRTLTVRVTDEGGLSATATATLEVRNVPPTASFSVTPGLLYAGQSAVLSFSGPTDPSAADVAAGFRYSYDCTGDGIFETADSPSAAQSCAYPSPGTFLARGRIKDKDNGFTDYTATVTVLSVRQGILGLIDQVNALVSSNVLSPGQGNSLLAKLNAAIQQLDHGNVQTVINQLNAFVNDVSQMIATGKLSPAQGQPLIDAANQIITALGG